MYKNEKKLFVLKEKNKFVNKFVKVVKIKKIGEKKEFNKLLKWLKLTKEIGFDFNDNKEEL